MARPRLAAPAFASGRRFCQFCCGARGAAAFVRLMHAQNFAMSHRVVARRFWVVDCRPRVGVPQFWCKSITDAAHNAWARNPPHTTKSHVCGSASARKLHEWYAGAGEARRRVVRSGAAHTRVNLLRQATTPPLYCLPHVPRLQGRGSIPGGDDLPQHAAEQWSHLSTVFPTGRDVFACPTCRDVFAHTKARGACQDPFARPTCRHLLAHSKARGACRDPVARPTRTKVRGACREWLRARLTFPLFMTGAPSG